MATTTPKPSNSRAYVVFDEVSLENDSMTAKISRGNENSRYTQRTVSRSEVATEWANWHKLPLLSGF